MKKEKQNNNFLNASRFTLHAVSGFSIVETIVAIAILSVAVVAPMSLAQRGLNSSIYAKDQVTAFYLAQEAVEYVRNVRDGNNYGGLSETPAWLFGLEKCTSAAGSPDKICGIDTALNSVLVSDHTTDCSASLTNCRLVFDPTLGVGIYGDFGSRSLGGSLPSPWQYTIFTRLVKIKTNGFNTPMVSDANAEAEVSVIVSWQTGLLSKSITITERIFDWYPAKTP